MSTLDMSDNVIYICYIYMCIMYMGWSLKLGTTFATWKPKMKTFQIIAEHIKDNSTTHIARCGYMSDLIMYLYKLHNTLKIWEIKYMWEAFCGIY